MIMYLVENNFSHKKLRWMTKLTPFIVSPVDCNGQEDTVELLGDKYDEKKQPGRRKFRNLGGWDNYYTLLEALEMVLQRNKKLRAR